MTQHRLSVAREFSRTPGPRYPQEGNFSGALFRRKILLVRIKAAISESEALLVDLDGTAGYGTSFLEEAFGGLIREDGLSAEAVGDVLRIKSDEEPYLIDDIRSYIAEAAEFEEADQ